MILIKTIVSDYCLILRDATLKHVFYQFVQQCCQESEGNAICVLFLWSTQIFQSVFFVAAKSF